MNCAAARWSRSAGTSPIRRAPRLLLAWLEPALSNRDDLIPDPLTVERELGRSSLSFGRARGVLERLWAELRAHSEVVLKRQLWDGLLREAYGTPVGDDALFLQHTYLTIVAKTIAARVLDLRPTTPPQSSPAARSTKPGIQGAVESDFFDWILEPPDGRDLVRRLPARPRVSASATSRSMSSSRCTRA